MISLYFTSTFSFSITRTDASIKNFEQALLNEAGEMLSVSIFFLIHARLFECFWLEEISFENNLQ
ncbi:hypothetical protein H4V97_001405 [Flavobacterium sp. CG_23.5]|nr:hypothetical protein [Flavobacterium sp. CG_9.10]MBP2283087.1 hypothetical protein [Flavobacterium sp. CG_23.5]